MDIVALAVSVLALVVSAVVGYFYLESVVQQTRKEYQANQPDVQVVDLSSMSTSGSLTLFPTVRNVSKVPAYQCTLTLDGWSGLIDLGTCYPPGHQFTEHQVNIHLAPDAPIRSGRVENARMRLRYCDYWGGRYEVSYPVEQVMQAQEQTYTPTVHLESPGHTWPNPSYFEIRKLLTNVPTRQW